MREPPSQGCREARGNFGREAFSTVPGMERPLLPLGPAPWVCRGAGVPGQPILRSWGSGGGVLMKEVGELCPLERRVGMGEMVFPEILRGPPTIPAFL